MGLEPITPAIMELPIWKKLRLYVIPIKNSDRSRAHICLRKLPEELLREAKNTFVKCGHPMCDVLIPIIRQHAQSDTWSVHPTGMRDSGHKRCSYVKEVKAQTLALQLDVGQAEQSPRIKKARKNAKQRTFVLKKTKDGFEFVP